MPILIMGVSAFMIFVVVMTIMVAAGLEERQNAGEEHKSQRYQGKAVKIS